MVRLLGEGDGVAEGFELADVVAFLDLWVCVFGEVIGTEVGEVGVLVQASRCQAMTRMERPTATTARFLPRRRAMRR